MDLLRREALNEQKAGEILEGQDKIPEALEHAANFQAYTRSIALLNEQMDRLKAVSAGIQTEIPKWWPGHPGEAG